MTRRADHAAERSILGNCVLDNKLIATAAALVSAADFDHPGHAAIFDAVVARATRGDGVDYVTLAAELQARGKLELAGGHAYVGDLGEAAITAAWLEDHCRIVADHAAARRLVAACAELAARAGDGRTPTADLLDLATSKLRAAAGDARRDARATTLGAGIEAYFEQIAAREQGRATPRTSTGFRALDDKLTGRGLGGGQLMLVAARPAMGKAQPLDARVLTPRGFVRMGDIRVGDEVIGADGRPCRVTGVHPQGVRPVYRVTATDGASTECCDEHLWFTRSRLESRRGSPGSVKTLREIRATIEVGSEPGRLNHRLPSMAPAVFSSAEPLPLDPYLLGLLLGDGSLRGSSVRLCNPERDVQDRAAAALPPGDLLHRASDGMSCRIARGTRGHGDGPAQTRTALAGLGLRDTCSLTKYIPPAYLTASIADRFALLRGLLDTDGHVNESGTSLEYSTSSPRLRDDVTFLARSLGGIVSVSERIPTYRSGGELRTGAASYRVRMVFPPGIVPVSSEKHLRRWRPTGSPMLRQITRVEFSRDVECQCITVDAPDRLYVTDDFLVTHNSAFSAKLCRNMVAASGKAGVFFSLEMPTGEVVGRLIADESRIPIGRVLAHAIDPATEMPRAVAAANALYALPLTIDDTGGATLFHVAAACRAKAAAPPGLGVVVVDYVQLMRAARDRDNRNAEIEEISRGLKALAKELDVPIVALAQLNREVEKRKDKRPQLSDLRDSGALEQDADIVAFLYRDVVYDKRTREPDVCEVILAKQRNGPTDTVRLRFVGELTRFEDIADTGADPAPGHDWHDADEKGWTN